jgi:hypothetical protein
LSIACNEHLANSDTSRRLNVNPDETRLRFDELAVRLPLLDDVALAGI